MDITSKEILGHDAYDNKLDYLKIVKKFEEIRSEGKVHKNQE